MIANILFKLLAEEFNTFLIPAENFFLERGAGNQNVIIKTVGVKNPIKSIPGMRSAKFYVSMNGYQQMVAKKMSESFAAFLETVNGNYEDLELEYKCDVKQLFIDQFPTPIGSTTTSNVAVYVFSFVIHYIEI